MADKEPTCEIEGSGEKKSCGIPRCIWDSQCYTGLGGLTFNNINYFRRLVSVRLVVS